MRVLLVNHRFAPAEGGTERWTLSLARALLRRGHRVTVLTQDEPGSPRREDLAGIEVHRLDVRHVAGFRWPQAYWRTLRSLDYDLLHLSGNRIWCADFYFPVAGVFGGPQVITPHDFYQLRMDPSSLNRWYFQRYLPRALAPFDAYLALTRSEAQLVGSFGYPQARIHLVGEGIDLADLRRDLPGMDLRQRFGLTRPLVALYVGGLWENKRVDRVLRSLAPLKEQVALLVVGRDLPGTRYDLAHVRDLARELGVEVAFAGSLDHATVLAAYRSADLYLQGSQYEGFGISLLEAQASGLPFVAFDTGVAGELAESGGGLVASTQESFNEHVRALALDDGRRREMGARGQRAAQAWDWETKVEGYLRIYREAVAAHDLGAT